MDRRTLEVEALLAEISAYCREAKLAETTFGRLAVNDGKLVGRLKNGSRITMDTIERVRSFIGNNASERTVTPSTAVTIRAAPVPAVQGDADAARNFRFFDNRQKYLLFVTTCSEKWVVAERVIMELENIRPKPPAVRIFDAGVG